MELLIHKNIALLILLYLLPLVIAQNHQKTQLLHPLQHNATNTSTYSPWLRGFDPWRAGCRRRPWICNQEDFPRIRRLCCRNRCVDITSDVNNCGFCGIRCRFTRQCCGGICINTDRNPFNCGKCGNVCPFPRFCIYGMCGYAQPLPPFPFPFPPRPPRPPFPFPPRPPRPSPLKSDPRKGGDWLPDPPPVG